MNIGYLLGDVGGRNINDHITLNNETADVNGEILMNFTESRTLKFMNWELREPIPWRI